MNWNDYNERPDEGLFEKISRRLAWRRALRVGGVGLGVAAVAVAAILLATPSAPEGMQVAEIQGVQEREVREVQGVREVREVQGVREVREVEGVREVEEVQGVREVREVKEVKEVRGVEEVQGVKEVRGVQETREVPEVQGVKEVPEVKEGQGVQNNFNFQLSTLNSDKPLNSDEPRNPDKGSAPEDPKPHYENLIWAPNVIIPDGVGNGEYENNLFRVVINSDVTEYHLYIYNRNGRQLYKTTDPAATWDATFDGMRLPQGTYVWVARFRDSDGNPRLEKGTVTVVR